MEAPAHYYYGPPDRTPLFQVQEGEPQTLPPKSFRGSGPNELEFVVSEGPHGAG